jgi:hypothetical protein
LVDRRRIELLPEACKATVLPLSLTAQIWLTDYLSHCTPPVIFLKYTYRSRTCRPAPLVTQAVSATSAWPTPLCTLKKWLVTYLIVRHQSRRYWCPPSDSNRDFTASKTVLSTNWSRRAIYNRIVFAFSITSWMLFVCWTDSKFASSYLEIKLNKPTCISLWQLAHNKTHLSISFLIFSQEYVLPVLEMPNSFWEGSRWWNSNASMQLL